MLKTTKPKSRLKKIKREKKESPSKIYTDQRNANSTKTDG